MKEQLKKRFERTNKIFIDLVEKLSQDELSSKLRNLPSNTIGQQLWCVIGARKSYLMAVEKGEWSGFSCPLDWEKCSNVIEVLTKLENTFQDLIAQFDRFENYTSKQQDFLFDLLEHEVLHHGQLIRYIYGLNLKVPSSWKERYSLEDTKKCC